jgi:hypothetical protein
MYDPVLGRYVLENWAFIQKYMEGNGNTNGFFETGTEYM